MKIRPSFEGTPGMLNLTGYWIALVGRAGRDQVILIIFMTLLAFLFLSSYARYYIK